MSERVVVVGGGVIGAMSAWNLSQAGCDVTIVDRDRFGAACSHGNCG
ncbi:MAG: FAD-dependent oxidoreductase, partial [Pirellulaceae bacterium]